MATTPRKKTKSTSSTGKRTAAASGKRSASGTGKRTAGSAGKRSTTAAGKRTSHAAPVRTSGKTNQASRPMRREIWGGVLLLLALCSLISYFDASALFISWFAVLMKGLFGYGYWMTCPALLLAGIILLTHHGRPVILRTACALLIPVQFGALLHMVLCQKVYPSSLSVLGLLWNDGLALASGGAVSGTLANASVAVFSKVASLILFTAVLAALLMISLQLTLGMLVDWGRDRPRYNEDTGPLPELPESAVRKQPAIRMTPIERPARSSTQRRSRMIIDIPLDDEPPPTEEEPKRFTGFFRHKSEGVQSPDELLMESDKPPKQPLRVTVGGTDPEEEEIPVVNLEPEPPRPAPAPTPVTPTAPVAAAAPVREKPKRVPPASDVASAAAAVTMEINQRSGVQTSYVFPTLDLLYVSKSENITETGAELRNNSRRLSETLSSFGVDASPGDVVHGPSVTRYEFTLDQGVKLSKITNLSDDIALALGASGVRIAPIPDKISVVGIEVPNKHVAPVSIREVLASDNFTRHPSQVAFALGKDIGGNCVVGDISTLPHVLIAGTTGSGKSVCTNSLIISLLYKSSPMDVRFIMVDPKMVELAPYNGIPHLLIPVVTDPNKAAGALQWAVHEMMNRYKQFSEHGVKKLSEYNRLADAPESGLEHMAALVVVIDELADLMLVAAKEVEESICRVAQMGRAAGVHLVIATQRPSSDVITGLMKANIPSRIAFAVASSLESRIILDTVGAEKLVGRGDMLYAPLGKGKPTRIQGCFIAPDEIDRVITFIKQNSGEVQYSDEVMQTIENSVKGKGGGKGGGSAAAAASAEAPEPSEEADELLPAAVEVILETGQASVSMLQRRLKLGYSRAARLVDQMEERGIVGPFEGSKPRQMRITKEQWQEMKMAGVLDVKALPAGGGGTPPTTDSV